MGFKAGKIISFKICILPAPSISAASKWLLGIALKPAIKMTIDFGEEIGIKKSSAQITDHYSSESLVGMQIAAVVNFPKKQIGPFMSECLVTGFTQPDGSIILAIPHKGAVNGSRLA